MRRREEHCLSELNSTGNPDDQDENTLRTQVTTSGREPFPPMARGGTSEDSARREERKPRTLGQGRNTAWSVAVAGVYVYTISDDRTERMIMQCCTESYSAVGIDGRSYTVRVCHNFTSSGPLNDPVPEAADFRTLCTSDGRYLNYIEKGQYQIVVTGVVLHSDDPDAP